MLSTQKNIKRKTGFKRPQGNFSTLLGNKFLALQKVLNVSLMQRKKAPLQNEAALGIYLIVINILKLKVEY